MDENKAMLVIQDDACSESLHLDEVLLSLIPSAERGAAAFAFVTVDGINAVFNSEEFKGYCRSGHHFELYVGIDSVTSKRALEYAKALSQQLNGRLIVKVYYNKGSKDIFHPKTTWFKLAGANAGGTMLVGSGNLTLSGLQKNTEVFGWIDQNSKDFAETVSRWNRWLDEASRSGRIFDIDDPVVIARASENRWNGKSSIRIASEVSDERLMTYGEDALLVSAIPSQKSRGWSQFAMAKRFYADYFGFEVETVGGRSVAVGSRRVLLHAVNDDGSLSPAESRKGNISGGSNNFRMEIDGARKVTVEKGQNPFVVFIRVGERSYIYQVFGTDSPFHDRLADFAVRHNSALKKTEKPKCWCDVQSLQQEMPELAIFKAEVPGEQD